MVEYGFKMVQISRSTRTLRGNSPTIRNEKSCDDVCRLAHQTPARRADSWSTVEDKLDTKSLKRKRSHKDDETALPSSDRSTSDSDSTSEDDAGELATEVLDSEIIATLNAIRSKDPRVYDQKTTFYTQTDSSHREHGDDTTAKNEKPMFLRDYHRQNLLGRAEEDSHEVHETPLTYTQEQEALRRSIVGEINAATTRDSASSSSDDDTDIRRDKNRFLVAKQREKERVERPVLDVANADKDPEAFLSNFMAARAWIPSERSQVQPFESDDDEEDRKADEFEEAYNFRFEDPAKSNDKLVSHARDMSAKYSVRREEKNARRKQREAEREKKEAAKRERAAEKARWRKLKIEEAEEKLRKVKQAAGLRGSAGISQDDWARFLDDDWDDAKWEEEMEKRFGEAYYAQNDASSDQGAPQSTKKSRKPRKPKWDDDIEIKDLIPDFDEEGPSFELSGEENERKAERSNGVDGHHKPTREHKKDYHHRQKEARKQRRIIEQLVDDRLKIDTALSGNAKTPVGFRYRNTSPLSFGLSPRDILMADDSQLNEYAGLKKLATFRDSSKKRRDQKRLGKKARLRQWRRDTFGNEDGPPPFESVAPDAYGEMENTSEANAMEAEINVQDGPTKKKRRRSKKTKGGEQVTV
jgi:protein KRI1